MKASNSHSVSPDKIASFFGSFKTEVSVASPGRINFIGEHTDYNDGFVLPAAIDSVITFRFQQKAKGHDCRVYSVNMDTLFSFNLGDLSPREEQWHNYIVGMIAKMQELTTGRMKGFDCIIESNLPIGAGISSSAALTCGLGIGLNALFALNLTREDLARASQKTEHDYIGTSCGIMDQYAVLMSVKDKVLFLDCQSEQFNLIHTDFQEYGILLLNTNVNHNNATSGYNERVLECQQALLVLKTIYSISSFRDLTSEMLKHGKEKLTTNQYKRVKYILEENERVVQAKEHLKNQDLVAFGKLLYTSHIGQQNDYEVSCPELDFLVEHSKEYSNILGARMMGGGFGGCVIHLIKKDTMETYIENARKAYQEKFGIELTSIIANICSGTWIF